jgi:chromosomal replication initiation ATPase DnaA
MNEVLPLVGQHVRSIEERVAQAEAFRNEIPRWLFRRIMLDIRKSAEECGEVERPPRGLPPEIAARGCPTIAEIQQMTAWHFDVSHEDILSSVLTNTLIRPRQVAMYLCRVLTAKSMSEIARRFGGRDHTTVIHAARRIEQRIETDAALAADVEALKGMLR